MVELNSWAAQELRSLNGQIEYLLREAIQHRKKIDISESNNDAEVKS